MMDVQQPGRAAEEKPVTLRPKTTGPVTVEAYDRAEREALAEIPVPVVMAFRPVTFQSVGYPVQVGSDRELLRYVDHNFEAEVPGLYRLGATFPPIGYVNAFTPDEARLVDRVRDVVADFTGARLGRRLRPMTNLLVQVSPYRVMDAIARAHGIDELEVFEAGPGLTYLGALLAMQGHRYSCYDVTQALYLWQSHLLDAVAGDEFCEFAHPENAGQVGRSRVGHLPWWSFAKQIFETSPICDIVYSNSNLGEMTTVSLRHLLEASRRMLSQSRIGAFIYFSPGMLAQNSPEGLEAEFRNFGFVKAMDKPFICYLPEGRDPRALVELFKDGIPFYNPSGSQERLDADTVVATPKEEAPLDVRLTQWFHGWDAPLT